MGSIICCAKNEDEMKLHTLSYVRIKNLNKSRSYSREIH